MSPNPSTPCPHDLGPGVTVCLRCRHETRVATRARTARSLGLVAMGALGLAIVGALGAAGMKALGERRLVSASQGLRVTEQSLATVAPAAHPAVSAGGVREAEAAATPAAPLTPVVPQGRSELGGGVYAVRAGGMVTVHFDTPLARTRRPDKYEATVRSTLPLIYGTGATRVLASIPRGTLAGTGDLLTDLPARGVRVPVTGGWTLAVWPETRPGQDGPLVVSYRALVTR